MQADKSFLVVLQSAVVKVITNMQADKKFLPMEFHFLFLLVLKLLKCW